MMIRIVSIILSAAILIAIVPAAAVSGRDISQEELLAADLKELGLFLGVTDSDFDLSRPPTRIEAVVMLIRLLGKENEALNGIYKHPFTDVPEWADPYIGYAYEKSLTNGISDSEFGDFYASGAMYLTFVLRSLGYTDRSVSQDSTADFAWENPFPLAEKTGILLSSVNVKSFLRADIVTVSYAALFANMKDSEIKLNQKLIENGVFTAEQYDSVYNSNALEILKPIATAVTENEFETEEIKHFRYLLYVPENAEPDMPLIIYLHGGSGKGDNLKLLTAAGFPKYLSDGDLGNIPAYILIPQLPAEIKGWTDVSDSVFALTDKITKDFKIDKNRISLTGHSMGGTGAWTIAALSPDIFSCVVPMSGSIKSTKENITALSKIAIWAFVGRQDTIVPPNSSIQFVAELKKAGGNAKITTLEQADHFSVPEVYLDRNCSVIGWMIEQCRNE